MNIKVQISQNLAGVYSVYVSPNCRLNLFDFSIQGWANKVAFNSGRVVILDGGLGAQFPMDYFVNLVKAKYFLETGVDKWPENVELTKSSLKLLKIK